MLELCKEILQKVSFDKSLFLKELKKAVNWVNQEELTSLKIWCLTMFGKMYRREIIDTFSQVPALA
ncbi:MAG: hypothetical protein ACLGGV_07955 [Bacteroidia bacterium]